MDGIQVMISYFVEKEIMVQRRFIMCLSYKFSVIQYNIVVYIIYRFFLVFFKMKMCYFGYICICK